MLLFTTNFAAEIGVDGRPWTTDIREYIWLSWIYLLGGNVMPESCLELKFLPAAVASSSRDRDRTRISTSTCQEPIRFTSFIIRAISRNGQ